MVIHQRNHQVPALPRGVPSYDLEVRGHVILNRIIRPIAAQRKYEPSYDIPLFEDPGGQSRLILLPVLIPEEQAQEYREGDVERYDGGAVEGIFCTGPGQRQEKERNGRYERRGAEEVQLLDDLLPGHVLRFRFLGIGEEDGHCQDWWDAQGEVDPEGWEGGDG